LLSVAISPDVTVFLAIIGKDLTAVQQQRRGDRLRDAFVLSSMEQPGHQAAGHEAGKAAQDADREPDRTTGRTSATDGKHAPPEPEDWQDRKIRTGWTTAHLLRSDMRAHPSSRGLRHARQPGGAAGHPH